MGTSKEIIAQILEQLASLDVRARAMFGGSTIYCDDKVVALVCDDRFYLKSTAAKATFDMTLEAGPPYPGARDCLILDDKIMLNGPLFSQMVQATADALPAPKPKKPRKA